VLEVRRLSVDFETERGPVHALSDVNLVIGAEESFGLAGESGSGKTTLAYAVMQYLAPNAQVTSGEILFRGMDLRQTRERDLRAIWGNRIAMVYQDPMSALNPSMRVGQQIAEVLHIHRPMTGAQAWGRAIELLDLVNIADPGAVARRYPHQLSGGMQQRVVIAMALACDPDLLIMDEPTTGLDVTTQARIIDLVADLKSKVRSAILYITHDLGVIAEVSDRVGVLYAGELVETGPTDVVFGRPAHPYTIGLLDALPNAMRGRRLKTIRGVLPDLTVRAPGCIFAPRCDFALAACTRERPGLEETGDEHFSRCLRWREVINERPATSPEAAPVQAYAGEQRVLAVEGLTKHYGEPGRLGRWLGRPGRPVRAVEEVSFDVSRGEVFALVGESGCGKTTLGRCIVGLLPPTAGRARFFSSRRGPGVEIATELELRRAVQVVFQNPDSSLNPTKKIRRILERPLTLAGMHSEERRQRVTTLLDAVKLDRAYLNRYPHELSGGEKQRVAIARAFALEPEFVLLDEPVSALDVSIQAAIVNLLVQLKVDIDCTYLFITHDLSLVRSIADRVAVMYLGRLCEMGPVEEVFAPPQHPYTRALLAAVPVPDPRMRRIPLRLEGAVPSPQSPPPGCPFHTRCPSKLGRVCEELEPPVQVEGGRHWIACHIPLDQLRREVPVTDVSRGDPS
jgi:peptide/nickel transport system ATP-binding protein